MSRTHIGIYSRYLLSSFLVGFIVLPWVFFSPPKVIVIVLDKPLFMADEIRGELRSAVGDLLVILSHSSCCAIILKIMSIGMCMSCSTTKNIIEDPQWFWEMKIKAYGINFSGICFLFLNLSKVNLLACVCKCWGQPVCSSTCYNTADKEGKQPCNVCSLTTVTWSKKKKRANDRVCVYLCVFQEVIFRFMPIFLTGFRYHLLLPQGVAQALSRKLRTKSPALITSPLLFNSWVKSHGCSVSADLADWQYV